MKAWAHFVFILSLVSPALGQGARDTVDWERQLETEKAISKAHIVRLERDSYLTRKLGSLTLRLEKDLNATVVLPPKKVFFNKTEERAVLLLIYKYTQALRERELVFTHLEFVSCWPQWASPVIWRVFYNKVIKVCLYYNMGGYVAPEEELVQKILDFERP